MWKEICNMIVVPNNDTLTSLNLVQKMSKYAPALSRLSELKDYQRVPGCISEVYIHASIDINGMIELQGTSDSLLARGILGLLKHSLRHIPASRLHLLTYEKLITSSEGLFSTLPPGRLNGLGNMLQITKQQISESNDVSLSSEVIDISGNDDNEEMEEEEENIDNSNIVGYDRENIVGLLEKYSNDVN